MCGFVAVTVCGYVYRYIAAWGTVTVVVTVAGMLVGAITILVAVWLRLRLVYAINAACACCCCCSGLGHEHVLTIVSVVVCYFSE